MKKCPYCVEEIQEQAIKCRYCGSMLHRTALATEWYRIQRGRRVAGVCAGLADQFGVSVTGIRLAFVILTFFGLWGILLYAVLWIVMPLRAGTIVSATNERELLATHSAEHGIFESEKQGEATQREPITGG